MNKSKQKNRNFHGSGSKLLPKSIRASINILAENMLRLLPFELLDEATYELVLDVNNRCLIKYGHGYFAAGYLMEVHNKVADLENSGAVKMIDLQRRPESNCTFVWPGV